jgi:alkylation response protein AidB-like acyl-CoA dehydrogenase
MHQPGVEVRRIKQIDGGAEFCEVFFTDARCPATTSSARSTRVGRSR